ncbi:MAG: hypothetical protein J6U54_07195 [Clostridiales bacterium]|nr:hypothetical protein [Clostridiales bacterium]
MGVMNTVKGFGRSCKMKLIKHSPKLCLIFGIAGVVGGTVLACNATLKAKDKIDERDKKLKDVKDKYTKLLATSEAAAEIDGEEYSIDIYDNEDCKHEITKIHVATALDITKDFVPAVISTGVGIGLLCGGHHTLNKRYMAMTAAYGGLQKTFNDYRSNVRLRFGDDVDKELLYGVSTITMTDLDTQEEVEIKTINDKQNVQNDESTKILFSEVSPFWTKDPEQNLHVIELTIHNMNNKLEQRGKENGRHAVMFLNEVLDNLGLPRTKAGQYLGWVYDPDVIHKIDAGIYSTARTNNAVNKFLDGAEPSIWLNFNVDGNVLDLV